MKTFLVVTIIFLSSFAIAGLVSGHGLGEETPMGSQMMFRMMEMMHGNLDKNETTDCAGLTDRELVEKGEEMMEQMMGKEAHERTEKTMTPEAHDNMRAMMGMWATGCVGDETMNTLMEKQGIVRPYGEDAKVQNQSGLIMVILGVIIGAVGGWAGNQLLRKR